MSRGQPQRVLVTGGTGMIGAALTRRLVEDGHEVALFVRADSQRLRLQGLEHRLRFLVGDIRDASALIRTVQEVRPQVVFHLASTAFNPPSISAQSHLETITMGTLNLLEALKAFPEVRVMAAGSAAEYGNGLRIREDQPLKPTTMLGAAKAAAGLLLQTYARLHHLQTVQLRIFTPYGIWERPARLIPHTILSALGRRDVALTSGQQQRDYFYLDDLVEALLLTMGRDLAPGSVLNLCSGTPVSVGQIVEHILSLMGHPVKALLGVLPTRDDEIQVCSGDNSAAQAALGWEPRTTLEEGLRRTIAWFTEHREQVLRLA